MRHDSSGTLDAWDNIVGTALVGSRAGGLAEDQAIKRALDVVVAAARFTPAAPVMPVKQVPR